MQDIALTSVILASKVEDTLEKIKNVLAVAFLVLKGESFEGRIEDIKVNRILSCLPILNLFHSQITDEHRTQVIQYERDLLISIEFNFTVTHPHFIALKLAKQLKLPKDSVQVAWNLLDDLFLNSDSILAFPPHTLALSALASSKKPIIEQFCQKESCKLFSFSDLNK